MAVAVLLSASILAPAEASAAARPGATNTGVPAGTALKKHSGDLTINTPGKVISGLDVYGNVTVNAKNVTIKNTRIRGTAAKVQRDLLRASGSNTAGLIVSDVTIKPDTPTVYQRIGIRLAGPSQTVQRVNVSGTVDGIRISSSGITVANSYLHDFKHYSWDPEHSGGSHDDAIQIEGGSSLNIVGNSISGGKNAAIQAAQNLSALSKMQVKSNYINGGICAVNIAKKSRPYMTGMVVSGNRFGRTLVYPKCPMIYVPTHSDLRPTSNVWDDTGKAIPLP